MLRVARFLRSFAGSGAGIGVEEVTLQANTGEPRAALFVRPRAGVGLPGWIVLHGVTVSGRHHPVLLRFVRALAGSGAAVIIPEIPEWRALQLEPEAADRAVEDSIEWLQTRPETRPAPYNLLGFSFGGTQAFITAARPTLRDRIGGVVAFGAYCDLRRAAHFMFTGEHEWRGVTRVLDPDPYGRWIIAGNYLPRVSEFSAMHGAAAAALQLAREAGRIGVFSGDPIYDEAKARLRDDLSPEEREVWDLIAPPSGTPVDLERAGRLAQRIVDAAEASGSPIIEPRSVLERLTQRVVLAHGFDDRLIPFTETLRLGEALPARIDASLHITRLFAHSDRGSLPIRAYPAELARYVALLNQALRPC